MAKRGQIVGYAMLEGNQKMGLKEILEKTGVLISTCSNIIRTAHQGASEIQRPDLCVDENLISLPNSVIGCNAVLSAAQNEHLVVIILQDAEHCRMTFTQLAEAGIYLFICFVLFCLFVYLFICLFICFSIYLSVGLFFIK